MSSVFEIVIFLMFLILAWWQKDMILWLMSGLATIYIAATYSDDLPAFCGLLFALAVYELYLGLMIAIQAGGPAKGLSQFKAMFSRVKR